MRALAVAAGLVAFAIAFATSPLFQAAERWQHVGKSRGPAL